MDAPSSSNSDGKMTVSEAELASRLLTAFQNATAIADDEGLPDLTIAQGYAIQRQVDRLFQAAGRKPIGWKIGLTSPEPMDGIIYADSELNDGDELDLASCCAPKIEGELLLQMANVPPADATNAALIASLAGVEIAIEVADSRIAGWPKQLGHGIADNASCGRIVRTAQCFSPSAIDWAGVQVRLLANGEQIAEGQGSNCMGGALNVYRWFLQNSAARGRSLQRGDIILTGSIAIPTPMAAETSYELVFEGLGKLGLRT